MLAFVLMTLTACVSAKSNSPGFANTVLSPPRPLKQPAPVISALKTEPERDFKLVIDAYKSGNADETLLMSRSVAVQYPNTPWYKRSLFLTERA